MFTGLTLFKARNDIIICNEYTFFDSASACSC